MPRENYNPTARRWGCLCLVAALLLAGVAVLLSGGALGQTATTDIGDEHPLSTNDTIRAYGSQGHVKGELDRYRMTIAVAEDGKDVGLGPSITRDTRNDYFRINYREDHERTIRILLPREYVTPYVQTEVEALSTPHVAEYEPARGGDYLSVTIHFTGQADVVLPLQRDSAASYSILEGFDSRIESATGVSPLGRDTEWKYHDGENLTKGAAYPLNSSEDSDVLVQYDATPEKADETWVNVPKGEKRKDPVYTFEKESANSTIYVVAKESPPPDIRVKKHPGSSDRIRGDIRELRLVPGRIADSIDIIPFIGDGED